MAKKFKIADTPDINLQKELKKLAKRANQRLVRLERAFDFKTHAQEKLLEMARLAGGLTKAGRVKYNKNLSNDTMKRLIKAVKQFLGSETSTVKGLRGKAKKRVAKGLGISEAEAKKITDKEVNQWAKFWTENWFEVVTNFIPASELYYFANNVIDNKWNFDETLNTFQEYFPQTDENIDELEAAVKGMFDWANSVKKARKNKSKRNK